MSIAMPFNALLVIDPAVHDAAALLDGRHANFDVLALAPSGDGLDQISAHLAGKTAISSLHILSHGTPGALLLAGQAVDLPMLEAHADALTAIAAALAPGADVVLYGCSVASGVQGRQFVAHLEAALDACVAASTGPVGASARGGAWTLASAGAGDYVSAFSPSAMAAYPGLLIEEYLTTGTDTPLLSSADDTVYANTASSLQADDAITGDAGYDTLIINATNSVVMNATTLLGFEKIQIAASAVSLTSHDSMVEPNAVFSVDGSGASGSFFWNGTAETDGRFLIEGSSGNDFLIAGGGADVISGNGGVDTIEGGNGANELHGGAGGDQIAGYGGNDAIYGDDGNDTLNGGVGDDYIYGGEQDDRLFGSIGFDWLYGNNGNDSLLGDIGVDFLFGGSGNDTLDGGVDGDTLYGGDGADDLFGGSEPDTLYGEAGSDTLYGGTGLDSYFGGLDNDRFIGTGFELNTDLIRDFAVGDTIEVIGSDLSALHNTNASDTITIDFLYNLTLGGVTAAMGKFQAFYNGSRTIISIVNNAAPVITSNGGASSAALGVSENQFAVTTVTATDADANTITYAISGGADAARFSINAATGVLVFAASPNAEAPTDADANNSYVVSVTASDGAGGSASQTLTVTVNDVNEAISITSNGGAATAAVNAAENQRAVTTVTALDLDGNTPVFSIIGGADMGKFSIDAATGVLQLISAPDFESPGDADINNSYVVEVQAADGFGLTVTQVLTVSVTNINEAPVIGSDGGAASAAVSMAENQNVATTVTGTDVDGDTLSFALTGGADQARFSIDAGTGVLSFINAPDFEAPGDADADNSYVVSVTASDGNGASDLQLITVSVVNANEAPAISSNGGAASAAIGVLENQTAVTTVTALDVDGDSAVFSITGGADQDKFNINAATGVLSFVAGPNFEAPADSDANNAYVVDVSASDGNGGADVQRITVAVTNINEAVTITSSAAVNMVEDETVATTVIAADPDGDPVSFSIDSGADQATFSIDAATGVLSFIAPPNFEAPTDADANNTYLVNVAASDGKGSTAVQAVTVTVTNANEELFITSNGAGASAAVSAAENQDAVTTVAATDIDGDTPVFSISGGVDQARFTINAATGALTFVALPDFETPADADANNSYLVNVSASDGQGNTDVQALTVSVTNLNETPAITSSGAVSVAENQLAVTTVTSLDPDGGAPAYSITGGADQGQFVIDAATGILRFAAAPNFELPADQDANNTYMVDVTVADGSGLSSVQTITATVVDANDSPLITSLGGAATADLSVPENQSAVTTVTATDVDANANPPVFAIAGGADQARFAINAATGVLTFIDSPDFENAGDAGANNIYVVAVSASDGAGAAALQTITVSVSDVEDTIAPPPPPPPAPAPVVLTPGNNVVVLTNGNDSLSINVAGILNGADAVNGGAGFDTLRLSAAQSLVFGPATLTNFESIVVTAGSQNLTFDNATVAAGSSFLVDAGASADALNFNGAAETDGAFRLLGGSANDVLTGGALADTISASAGNDVIGGGGGNDIIDGGAGMDVLVLSGAARADYTMRIAGGQLVLTQRGAGIDGADTVANMETLRFQGSSAGAAPVTVDFDDTDVAMLVRVYETVFNRRPDEAGINFWINASEGGNRMQRIAEWFVASSEFQSAGPLSNDAFVGLLYQNGLDRTGSAAEVAQWSALLANGSLDRAGLLLEFAGSDELAALIGPITTSIATM